MSKSKLGYKKNSPYNKEPFITIDSNRITMRGVDRDLLLIPNNDKPVIAKAQTKLKAQQGDYMFPNSTQVVEIPLDMNKQQGGLVQYLESLEPEAQDAFVDHIESLEPAEQQELIKYMEGGYYQDGGPVIEVENQETVYLPNGELQKFEGKTHDEGGIEVIVPGGSYIFSEYRKAPEQVAQQLLGKGKKMSYANISKKFPTKPYMDILEDSKDKYKRNLAELKLAKNQANLEILFHAQEFEKKQESNEFQQGGQTRPTTPVPLIRINNTYNTLEDIVLPQTFKRSEPRKVQEFFPGWHSDPNYISTGQMFRPDDKPTGAFFDLNPPVDLTPPANTTPINVYLPDRTQPVSNNSKGKTPANIPARTPPATTLPVTRKPVANLDLLPTISPKVTRDSGVPSELKELSNLSLISTDSDPQPNKKRGFNFDGIDTKLAGTILDIGLALNDDLKVQNPILHDRRKTPMFNRFVDFDDKEVSKMYSLALKQIQQSNQPQQVKEARIADLTAKLQDYRSRVDLQNLQRYEDKRERDLNKLQGYTDQNIDIRVADIESYRERKAKVDFLRDQFKAQRKSRVVNSIKDYANYADQINYANQLAAQNYTKNPITGKINFKEVPKSQLDKEADLLNQYAQNPNNRISLPNGSVFIQLSPGAGIVIDKDGKSTSVNLK